MGTQLQQIGISRDPMQIATKPAPALSAGYPQKVVPVSEKFSVSSPENPGNRATPLPPEAALFDQRLLVSQYE